MRNQNLPAGQALGAALHVALLLLVLSQVVFLASRYRARIDLTADKLYTLTDSTRRVIEGLEEKLLIEAYFSPDDTVPPDYRDCRPNIRNYLDELVQLGNGRVVVQELNPLDDKELADKAQRLGIRPIPTQQQAAGSVSILELWQGLRLRYGGERQKIIPLVHPQYSIPTQLELTITPAIKEVTLEEKTRVGFMEWQYEPAVALGANAVDEDPQGWFQVRNMPQVTGRYEFYNLRYADALVPDNIETLLLFRPKELSDREKYIIDQFVMQGKKLVVFADSMDYSIGQARRFNKRPFTYDAPDSEVRFLDQLAQYGIRVQETLVADMQPQVQGRLGVRRVMGNLGGVQGYYWLPLYPYFFRPVDVDWAEFAAQLAGGNAVVADRYRDLFKPGIIKSNPLTEMMARAMAQPTGGPEFYWACPVGLTDRLPDDVKGEELLYTSPFTLIMDPPPSSTQPMNFMGSADVQEQMYGSFMNELRDLINSEPRRQVSVMASVTGRFTSAFEGKTIPRAFGEEEPPPAVDPLDEPIKDDPLAEPPGEPGGAAQTGQSGAEQTGGGDQGERSDEQQADENTAVDASGQEPEQAGPPAPSDDPRQAAGDEESGPVYRSIADAQVVVVGDADFLRDDLVGRPRQNPYDYQQIGGPWSETGRAFFVSMLDWVHQETDLNAITNRNVTSRVLSFAQQDVQRERIEDFRERLEAKTSRLQWLNIAIPPLLLIVFGLVLASMRHAHKKSFLASMES